MQIVSALGTSLAILFIAIGLFMIQEVLSECIAGFYSEDRRKSVDRGKVFGHLCHPTQIKSTATIRIATQWHAGTSMHLDKETFSLPPSRDAAGQKKRNFPDAFTEEIHMDFRVRPGEIQEDQLTAMMEHYSARWPSSLFMGAAVASMVASLVFKCQRKEQHALFIGQWAAPFLILGLYNKTVKQHGSDTNHGHGPEHNGPPRPDQQPR